MLQRHQPKFEQYAGKASRSLGRVRRQILGSPLGQTKVFGIGLNKTGTSTLGACFRSFGLRHLYDPHTLTRFYQDGDFDSIFGVLDQYDSGEDWPFPFIYKELFERYGKNALFIMTVRDSPERWLKSLKAHSLTTNPNRHLRKVAYGYDYPHEDEAAHLRIYREHTESVRHFFAERGAADQLLEVCWERGDGWTELSDFLGVRKPWVGFPHINSGQGGSHVFRKANIARIEEATGCRFEDF